MVNVGEEVRGLETLERAGAEVVNKLNHPCIGSHTACHNLLLLQEGAVVTVDNVERLSLIGRLRLIGDNTKDNVATTTGLVESTDAVDDLLSNDIIREGANVVLANRDDSAVTVLSLLVAVDVEGLVARKSACTSKDSALLGGKEVLTSGNHGLTKEARGIIIVRVRVGLSSAADNLLGLLDSLLGSLLLLGIGVKDNTESLGHDSHSSLVLLGLLIALALSLNSLLSISCSCAESRCRELPTLRLELEVLLVGRGITHRPLTSKIVVLVHVDVSSVGANVNNVELESYKTLVDTHPVIDCLETACGKVSN